MSVNIATQAYFSLTFDGFSNPLRPVQGPTVMVYLYKCPNDSCGEITVIAKGHGSQEFKKIDTTICPPVQCINFPIYVPEQIRNDYKEASSIKELSPKASATLSRRCLQGMIRDFWKVSDKKNLHQEIESLRGKIDDDILSSLLALKSVGNIGAHPETDVDLMVDVEPEEATQLLELIEFLITDWYIARKKRTGLLESIKLIGQKKEDQRKQL
ncbi:MAG: DUF4145 domain-containing protein [Eubacteriales bacterium]